MTFVRRLGGEGIKSSVCSIQTKSIVIIRAAYGWCANKTVQFLSLTKCKQLHM